MFIKLGNKLSLKDLKFTCHLCMVSIQEFLVIYDLRPRIVTLTQHTYISHYMVC